MLQGLSSREFVSMSLKKILTTEIPTIHRGTPYWRAVKVCALMVFLAEVIMVLALLLNHVSLTEFSQISLSLLLLWPIMPMILRVRSIGIFSVVCAVLVAILVSMMAMKIGGQYYIKNVFGAYLQNEDYHARSDSLSKFASSNAIIYTRFLIDESDFLKRIVLEAKQLKEKNKHAKTEEISKLRKLIIERMDGLDERLIATGYHNSNSVVACEALRRKYSHLLNSLEGMLNGLDDPCVDVGIGK